MDELKPVIGVVVAILALALFAKAMPGIMASMQIETPTNLELIENNWFSNSSTTLTVTQDSGIGEFEFIGNFSFTMTDQYANIYPLTPILMAANVGNDEGIWTAYHYGLARTSGPGVGSYGDIVAYFEVWDARNLTSAWGGNAAQYEFSRSGWGAYTISINNHLVWSLAGLWPTYIPPAAGFVDGLLYVNGTHTP